MKKRVNITVDEELHEWATKHFGEREFSKAISDQLICISSSIEAAKEIVDQEVVFNLSKEMLTDLQVYHGLTLEDIKRSISEMLSYEDKMAEDKNIQFDFELAQKLADSLDGQKVEQLKGVDLSEEDLKTQALKEFETSMELYQKYENTEEGYPLHMTEKELATMARITKKGNLMDEELRRKRIQAKVERILEPTRRALTEALFEIELEANKIARPWLY